MHTVSQTGRQTVALTHTELSDELNGTERRIGPGTRWATQILLRASHAVCVTSKEIIHFHVSPLEFAAHSSVVNFSNTKSEMGSVWNDDLCAAGVETVSESNVFILLLNVLDLVSGSDF